jgi:hypothetical protein
MAWRVFVENWYREHYPDDPGWYLYVERRGRRKEQRPEGQSKMLSRKQILWQLTSGGTLGGKRVVSK